MVCYGPSKGCKRCRQRKIKCDERRPFCRNCEKSKRDCPGYDRGEGAISFRDETKHITEQQSRQPSPGTITHNDARSSPGPTQARRRLKSSSRHQSRDSKHYGSVLISPSPNTNFDMMVIRPDTAPIVVTNDFIPLGIPRDPEQQSLSFFLTNFALLAERTGEIWGGFLETLPSLLEKAPSKSPLAAAASTTALASIAWTPGNQEYRQQALGRYVTSLKRINEALKDPHEAKSDNVLMAVLMLGFYENIKTLTLERSDREAHVRGAVALIKARKPDSFQSKESLRLFLAVRAQLLSLCIEKCDPAPFEDFNNATNGTIPTDYTPSSADRLVMLSEPLPSLLQSQRLMLSIADPSDQQVIASNLLTSCYQLEESLAYWSTMIPPEFQYTSLPFPDPTHIHEDWYPNGLDIYTDYTMASTWNTWRITRIRVLSIILSCLNILEHSSASSSPYEDSAQNRSPEYESTMTTISSLLNAICSSVPYHLGFHDQRVSLTSPQPTPQKSIDPFNFSQDQSIDYQSISSPHQNQSNSQPISQTISPTTFSPPQSAHSSFHNHSPQHFPSIPTKVLPLTDRTAFEIYPHPPGEAHYPEGFEASGAVGGWLMMQPLGFVARCEYTAPSMKEWVRGYLGTFLREGRGP